MATVFCADQKQITLPHSADDDIDTGIKGRSKDEQPNSNEQRARSTAHRSNVVVFGPDRTAEVSDEVADELVRLFPNSCFKVPRTAKSE